MSLLIDQAYPLKEDTEREIARLLNDFQDKTGLTVQLLSHVKASHHEPLRPAKIISVQLSAGLQ